VPLRWLRSRRIFAALIFRQHGSVCLALDLRPLRTRVFGAATALLWGGIRICSLVPSRPGPTCTEPSSEAPAVTGMASLQHGRQLLGVTGGGIPARPPTCCGACAGGRPSATRRPSRSGGPSPRPRSPPPVRSMPWPAPRREIRGCGGGSWRSCWWPTAVCAGANTSPSPPPGRPRPPAHHRRPPGPRDPLDAQGGPAQRPAPAGDHVLRPPPPDGPRRPRRASPGRGAG
jgi:hypothetical protein